VNPQNNGAVGTRTPAGSLENAITPPSRQVSEGRPKHPGALTRRIFGPALSLKEINVCCWALFVCLLVLPTCLAVGSLIRSERSPRQALDVDFVYFYAMGRMFNEYPAGQLYDYELQKKVCNAILPAKAGDSAFGPNPYSPFVGIVFRPFARLPFLPAFVLWLLISFFLYIVGLFFLARRFFPDDSLRRSLIFCFGLSFCPFFFTLTGGQISTIGFFALALAFREEGRQRPVLSGLALSLCMYKPTLLILLLPMLLITRRYKTLMGFAGGATVVAAFVTAVQGVGVWPGYIALLLSFGSAVSHIHSFVVLWYHVDLNSFSSLIRGGRSLVGGSIIIGFAGVAGVALVRTWWKSRGSGKPASTLVWATTLTWTLVLSPYVPFHDCILVVLSLVATAAALKDVPSRRLRNQFTLLWMLILASSWITLKVAQSSGFQIFTILFASLGILQLAALRKVRGLAPEVQSSGYGVTLTSSAPVPH
jgi:hypothetical protein